MNTLTLKDFKQENRINELAAYFEADLQNVNGEQKFKFDNARGKGFIKAMDFDSGVAAIFISLELLQEFNINFSFERRHPVLFHFTRLGKVKLTSVPDHKQHVIGANKAMVFSPASKGDYSITFPPNLNVQCIVVEVIRNHFLKKLKSEVYHIPDSIEAMFNDTEGINGFFHKSSADTIILNSAADIFKKDEKQLESTLLLEANVLKLISSMISSFKNKSNINNTAYWFSNEDIDRINKVRNYIINNLKDNRNVESLAQMVGLSENKLQKGFQMLFGKSIKQFTITMRMHEALTLMEENNRTISEIAYKMGYSNIGHFSDLFRREFGMLPSEYKSRINH